MWTIETLQNFLTPEIKLIITWSIAFALFVVYCWTPGSNKKKKPKLENSVMNYLEVDPYDLQGDPKKIHPTPIRNKWSNSETLENLDEYVKALKENQINNIDEV